MLRRKVGLPITKMANQIRRFFGLVLKKKILFLVILIGMAVAGFFASRLFKKTPQATYQTATVERGALISTVSASGQVLTANIIDVATDATGLVKQVYVSDGDSVAAGQKILEITLDAAGRQKNASAWTSYLSAQKSVTDAQTSLYSLKSDLLTKEDAFQTVKETTSYATDEERLAFHVAENNYLSAKAKYDNQATVISQAQLAVNNAWLAYQTSSPVVTAPVSGTVSNLTYSEGMVLGGSQDATPRLAVIRSAGTPLVSFDVSEIDVSNVKPGQKATVKLDSLADKTFTGKVLNVDRIGTVTSNVTNYPVVIGFDTEAPDVLPNMSATASIILETKDNVLLVPSSAIQKQGTQNVVRVMKAGQEQTVPVETGLTSDTQTEITSGLSEGDEVITSTTASSNSSTGGRSVFGTGAFGGGGGSVRMFRGD